LSLAEDFEANQKLGGYPDHSDIADQLNATEIHYEIVDEIRWGHVVEYVYSSGLEFARVIYRQGSGDSEYDYQPEWTAVRPVLKTIVTYQKLD